MSNYEKPVVFLNEEFAEGVYAASGVVGGVTDSNCWTVTAYIHQTQETGRHDYRIQIDAFHANPAPTHSSSAVVTIVFNKSVVVSSYGSGSDYGQGSGTAVKVKIGPGTSNSNESVGLGDFYVTADEGLQIISVGIQCLGK